jgi:hypothetical protein
MAWSVLIQNIYPSPSNNGSKDLVVIYSDGVREVRQQYNLHSESYPNTASVSEFIQQQLVFLDQPEVINEEESV